MDNDIKIKCSVCGEQLNIKERLTYSIYGAAMCDVCMGKQRRNELAKEGYAHLLESIPAIYRETKFPEKSLSEYLNKSAVILAEESPIVGSQWGWDTIKLYWSRGLIAGCLSAKSASIEYSSSPWQQKKDYVDYYAEKPGMLVIDDIDYDAPRELLSRIIEYRAEHMLDTLIIIHIPYDELDKVIGDKAESLIKSKWKCLAMERQ